MQSPLHEGLPMPRDGDMPTERRRHFAPGMLHSSSDDGECRPPGDDDSVFLTGLVLFVAHLSSSFATFTIEVRPGSSLDVIVSRKRARARAHLASIMEEVKRCQDALLPVTVHGYKPFDKCSCQKDCQSCVVKCWNINDLPMPDAEQPLLCQEIELPLLPSASVAAAATFKAHQLDGCGAGGNISDNRKRTVVKNRSRAARFVDLLIDVIGVDALKTTSSVGILDVAGGGSNAGITFELSLRRKMPSTVIDPRSVKLNQTQRRTLKFREVNRKKLKLGIEISHCARALYIRFREWTPSQLQHLFDENFATSEVGDQMLRDCVAVVGMHPDEATDAIIELAMRYNKPWMICPCCVFPRTFKRTLSNGQAVQTYDDLCEYIRNITSGVQEKILDFEGRNRVFFWLPNDGRGCK